MKPTFFAMPKLEPDNYVIIYTGIWGLLSKEVVCCSGVDPQDKATLLRANAQSSLKIADWLDQGKTPEQIHDLVCSTLEAESEAYQRAAQAEAVVH